MRYLGKTAKSIRIKLGMKQEAMAKALGISVVHLSNIENNKAMPSSELITKYREVSGVDIYVLDWCEDVEASELPIALQTAALKLRDLWVSQI